MGRGTGLHSDNHALAFDRTDENHLLEGNDGGLYESYDHGITWRHFNNIPVTQFYRVSVDNGLPYYNVYGGTQDERLAGRPLADPLFGGHPHRRLDEHGWRRRLPVARRPGRCIHCVHLARR